MFLAPTLPGPLRDLSLEPCGHPIIGFVVNADGDVTELRTTP
jgi:hypothetical protein